MTDSSLAQAIFERGIDEVLHFTTNNGLVGMLHTGHLSANAHLRAEQRLTHVLKINSADRSRDLVWHGYVNLSVSRINDYFYKYSKSRVKHAHAYWCILSFGSTILMHHGVHFATTNNAYPLTTRATGALGLEALFAPSIPRKPTWTAQRAAGESLFHPTCRQAEALYPGHVSLEHLNKIYVERGEVHDEVCAQVAMLAPHLLSHVQIVVDPTKFI